MLVQTNRIKANDDEVMVGCPNDSSLSWVVPVEEHPDLSSSPLDLRSTQKEEHSSRKRY